MSFVVDSLVIPHTRASASVSQTCVHFRSAETRPAELEMVAARITSKDITQAGSVAKLVASLLDIAANGGIKPLVSLLESGTEVSQKHSSNALTRLATDNSENQAQIAKRLVGLLDHDRRAEVMFVGKIPEMPAGYWIGVEYDEPVGKNDGSVKGRRCFECALDYGGFLRPDKIRPDPDPPVARRKPQKEHELMGAEGSLAIDGGALAEANAIPELGNATARTGSVTARSSASNLASTSTAARSTTPNASLFSR